MTSTPAEQLLEFIARECLRSGADGLTEDTPLVSSGLIDSLSIVTLVTQLESVTGRRIPPGRIRPQDLETVRTMLAAAERAGRPI